MTYNVALEKTKHAPDRGDHETLDQAGKLSFLSGHSGQVKTDYCKSCGAHRLALCSGLKGAELSQFGQKSKHKKLNAGQMLFGEFDEAKYFYTVVSGEVRLSRMLDDGRRQITGFKSTGDFIGLGVDGHYAADAEAIDDVVLCLFTVPNMNTSLAEYTEVQSRLMEMMQTEVIKLQNHMLLLGRKTPIEKISNFLCERANRKFLVEGQEDETNSVEIRLPMSRTDIADFLGLTIETVSRTITKLRKLGIIELQTSQNVLVTDLYELQLLANGDA
ncbi:MAG: helix-turn-helix domain-containing protein [Sneathiella sp.]